MVERVLEAIKRCNKVRYHIEEPGQRESRGNVPGEYGSVFLSDHPHVSSVQYDPGDQLPLKIIFKHSFEVKRDDLKAAGYKVLYSSEIASHRNHEIGEEKEPKVTGRVLCRAQVAKYPGFSTEIHLSSDEKHTDAILRAIFKQFENTQ